MSNEIAASVDESLEELAVLAESAGAEVVDRMLQSREAPQAATLIGSGKVEELAQQVKATSIDVVIFDRDLTPTQQRNLEASLECKVVDRTQLILDIFARRARTREGQMQVELAQLNYLLPRLAGRGIQMSRLGGGIGTRGPGETQLEMDRRRILQRITRMKSDLESVRAGRGIQRRQRQSVPLATVGLVGYTNAGKSTLFNRLTGARRGGRCANVRHSGSDGAAVHAAFASARAAQRHGGIHSQLTYDTGEGISGDAGRGDRSCAIAPRRGRLPQNTRPTTRGT